MELLEWVAGKVIWLLLTGLFLAVVIACVCALITIHGEGMRDYTPLSLLVTTVLLLLGGTGTWETGKRLCA